MTRDCEPRLRYQHRGAGRLARLESAVRFGSFGECQDPLRFAGDLADGTRANSSSAMASMCERGVA